MADSPLMIFKTLVLLAQPATVRLVDTVEHQGMFWLVPHWRELPNTQWMTPARIIALASLGHVQDLGPSHQGHRFVVNGPVPRELFDPTIPNQLRDRYIIVDEPDLKSLHIDPI